MHLHKYLHIIIAKYKIIYYCVMNNNITYTLDFSE